MLSLPLCKLYHYNLFGKPKVYVHFALLELIVVEIGRSLWNQSLKNTIYVVAIYGNSK